MKSVKWTKGIFTPFVEGNAALPMPYQFQYAVRNAVITLAGNIVISAKAGTILQSLAAAADGSTLFPYLLRLFGSLSFIGTAIDGTKGWKLNNVPAWVLWWQHFIETGVKLPVSDGGMAAANFAAGTYAVSISVPLDHVDFGMPQSQWGGCYFRPTRYNKQPVIQISGGTLFKAGDLSNSDFVASIGETTTPATLAYTFSGMQYTMTAALVPDFAFGAGDKCFDRSFNYIPLRNAIASNYNSQVLQDLDFQHFLSLISTTKQGVTAANNGANELGSAGVLGAANQNIIETDLGTTIVSNPYAPNLFAADSADLMMAGNTWPIGGYVEDMCGRSFGDWQKKTLLMPNQASFVVNANGTPVTPSGQVLGSNFYIIQSTFTISQAAKNAQGKFPDFAGY